MSVPIHPVWPVLVTLASPGSRFSKLRGDPGQYRWRNLIAVSALYRGLTGGCPMEPAAPMSTSPATAIKRESVELRTRRLAAARRRATALLGAVTVLFVAVTAFGAHGTFLTYLQAGAEAAMVGGVADWFAVTALFRHPLGLPIPHTAVIVERKDQFAATLGQFVQENFLNGDVLAERIGSAGLVPRLGGWLADEGNAAPLRRSRRRSGRHGGRGLFAMRTSSA